jgi:hypothetical protein
MKRLLPILLLSLFACDPHVDPPASLLSGDWSLSLSVTGPGGTCSFTAAPVSLNESGGSFSGTYGPTEFFCNGASQGQVGGKILNGVLSGSSVAWDLDEAADHQTGVLNGPAMSGSSVWSVTSNGTTVILNGTWSATRK